MAQKWLKIAQKWPKIAKMAQKLPKMAQKLAPAKKIAEIYLQYLQLFASLPAALMPAWAESHLRERKELAVAQTIGALIAVKLSIHNPWRGRCIDKHKHGLLVPKMCIQETAPMVACLSKANGISSSQTKWQKISSGDNEPPTEI